MTSHKPRVSRHRCVAAFFAASAMALSASVVTADIVPIVSDPFASTESLGEFTGSLEYAHDTGTAGTLYVSITNTSEPGNSGYLTGFLFHIDSQDPSATAELIAGTHPFLDAGGQNAPPFGGPFAGGAALGGHWAGGGNPTQGIAVGDTGDFTFAVQASDAGSLSTSNFIFGPNPVNFVARFRGFNDGGSDKVPAIPAPSALALLAIALACGGRRRTDTASSGGCAGSYPTVHSPGLDRHHEPSR